MSDDEHRQIVPRTALAERIAEVAGAGGVVIVAAEAGTGKTALAEQAVTLLGGAGAVQVHDAAERLGSPGLVELGRTLCARPERTGAIVLGRRDPGLCAVELGTTGPVLELDGTDLAWSVVEAAEGLDRWATGGDAEQLVVRTEGWCAAIRLAALVGEHALAPTSEPFKDYIFSEALRGVPEELVGALTRLSFRDRFALDDELADLHRRRLFLRPAAPGEWRVHRLVAAVVRRRLLVEQPAVARRLRHHLADAQAVSDEVIADPILARHAWSLLLDGALTQPSPAALRVAGAGPEPLRRAAALALLAVGDARRAEPLLAGAARSGDPAQSLARIMLARLAGDAEGVAAGAAALAEESDDAGLSAMASVETGILEHDRGRIVAAEQRLSAAVELARRAGREAVAGRARGALALLCLRSGRLGDAVRHAEHAVLDTPRGFVDGRVRARLALAQAAYFRDERLAAVELMEEARREAGGSRDEALWLLVLQHEALVRSGLGDYDRARFALAAARATAPEHPIGVLIGPLLLWLEARMLELEGRFDEAVAAAAAMPPGAGADLAAARRLVREQRPREAMALLDAAAQAVGPLHPFAVRRTFDLVALAVAAGAAAEDEAARSAIERALDLAAPELLRRPFLDEMVRLRPLLERHVAAGSKHGAFVGDLLRRAEHGGPAALEAPLKEPLTERERTVLGLLPSGLTAAEIAATLTVSEATVRTHMRHIYEKLGVANRQDAIQRGVELRYLARDLLPNRYS